MADISTLTSGLAGRYATALFELACEKNTQDAVEKSLDLLDEAIRTNDDLREAVHSPLYPREEQAAALTALCDAMGLRPLVRNIVGVMAHKRRLFVLPAMIAAYRQLMAEHRGEVTADVTAARLLSDTQVEALRQTLAEASGRQVKMNIVIDPDLIGGLIVKLGSRMVDTSIRAKLQGLQSAMKEVG